MWNKQKRPRADVIREYNDPQTGQRIKEVHKCPLGIVASPFWTKAVVITLTGIGSLGLWGAQKGYDSFASVAEMASTSKIYVDQIKQTNLPERIVRIEVTQQTAHEAQERMETKLDRLFEVWHQPNPAPKPNIP